MTIQELLFRLGVLSKSKAYQPIVYAIELRLSSEGWDPSLKKLQQEVAKVHACTCLLYTSDVYKRQQLRRRGTVLF